MSVDEETPTALPLDDVAAAEPHALRRARLGYAERLARQLGAGEARARTDGKLALLGCGHVCARGGAREFGNRERRHRWQLAVGGGRRLGLGAGSWALNDRAECPVDA
jgi:hypothetical protein